MADERELRHDGTQPVDLRTLRDEWGPMPPAPPPPPPLDSPTGKQALESRESSLTPLPENSPSHFPSPPVLNDVPGAALADAPSQEEAEAHLHSQDAPNVEDDRRGHCSEGGAHVDIAMVIDLQKQYEREVHALEDKQDDMDKEMRKWQTDFEKRLQRQVEVVRRILLIIVNRLGVDYPSADDGVSVDEPGMGDDLPPAPSSTTPSSMPTSEPIRSTGKRVPSRSHTPRLSHSPKKYNSPSRTPVPQSKPVRAATTPEASKLKTAPSLAAEPESNSSKPKPRLISPPNLPPNIRSSKVSITTPSGTTRPVFHFYPHPATARDQWAEYRYGLNGQPAVEALDLRYGSRWRGEEYARTWYCRRKKFWDRVKQLIAGGLSEDEAVERMEGLAGGNVAGLVDRIVKETRSEKRKRKVMGQREGRKKRRVESEDDEEEDGREDAEHGEPGILVAGYGDDVTTQDRMKWESKMRLRKRRPRLVDPDADWEESDFES